MYVGSGELFGDYSTPDSRLTLDQIAKYERYDYPGQYQQVADGQGSSRIRMQADGVGYHVVRGASQCVFFCAGVVGPLVNLNSGGAAGSGSPPSPTAPAAPDAPSDAKQAKPTAPTEADDSQTGTKSAPDALN